MKFKTIRNTIMLSALTWGFLAVPVSAQLHQDLQDVFERMLEDLDDDIRDNFEKAIEAKTPEVEFSVEEFRRFQTSPANPFEGIDHINPDDVSGNVILKFELPSLRNRSKAKFERQNPAMLQQFKSVVADASLSTVAIKSGSKQLCLGIVVDSNGLVLTKASELTNHKTVRCEFSDGQILSAEVRKTDDRNDLALLKVKASELVKVVWANEQPRLGAFVLTPDNRQKVLFMGTYSVTPRSTVNGKQAFLGVRPEATDRGIRIGEVTPETAAYDAGLQNGDVILSFEGVPMREVSDLVNIVRKHIPGDVVRIEYERDGNFATASATLAGRNLSGEQAAEFKMMSRLGAIPSRRADNFPNVFQHDTPLFPEQCGGPIVDLQGRVIGMNIARNGRACSYAIPASHINAILPDLLREDVAKRQ